MEEETIDDVDGDEDIDMIDVEQKRRGRPRKSFKDSGIDSKKKKTDDLLQIIRENAIKQNTT